MIKCIIEKKKKTQTITSKATSIVKWREYVPEANNKSTSSVSQYLSLLRNLHIPKNKINFVIFYEIVCVFSTIPLTMYYFIILVLYTINK